MIRTFEKDSREYKALEAVAKILNIICTNGYNFYVKNVYFDIGQDWMWTTIVADNGESSYQVLNPRDHELITENICWTRLSQAINNLIADSKNYSSIAKFT